MSNQFLSEIHRYIREKIAEAEASVENAAGKGDGGSMRFHQGELRQWRDIQTLITVHYNLSTHHYH